MQAKHIVTGAGVILALVVAYGIVKSPSKEVEEAPRWNHVEPRWQKGVVYTTQHHHVPEGAQVVDHDEFMKMCAQGGISQKVLSDSIIDAGWAGNATGAQYHLAKNGMVDRVALVIDPQWKPGYDCRLRITVSGQYRGNDYRSQSFDAIVTTFKVNHEGDLVAIDAKPF